MISTIVSGLILLYLAYEANAWLPKVIDKAIRLAASRLPKRQRERYLEEWRAHITELPGAAAKLFQCVGFLFAAGGMYPRRARLLRSMRSQARVNFVYRIFRRSIDALGSAMLIIFMAPALLGVACILKLSGDGAVLVRQSRIGERGQRFNMYYFRLPHTGDSHTDDQDLAPISRFIYSIKELPHLFNVLRGDITFVGPTPTGDDVPSVKPGIIGARAQSAMKSHVQIIWAIIKAAFKR